MNLARLYSYWLHFLRYANSIDLHSAKSSGNNDVAAWCMLRISDLDRQIDKCRMQMYADKAVLCACLISALPWEML